MLTEGMNVDPSIHILTLQNKLAQAAVREAQMEAAIQQLITRNQQLEAELLSRPDTVGAAEPPDIEREG